MTAGCRTTERLWSFTLAWVLGALTLHLAAAQGVISSGGSPAVPNEVVLRQQVVPYALESVYWSLDKANTPFLKEPELSNQGVFRALLRFGKKDTNNAMPLVWDQPKSRLYLDLNRNLDLTDDPAGVFSSTNKGIEQRFTNVIVLLQTTAGLHPAILGVRLWSDGAGHQIHA